MKVKASVKPICAKCKVIKRKGKVMIISLVPLDLDILKNELA